MKNRRKQRASRTHAPMWAAVVALFSICFLGFWGVKGIFTVTDTWTEDLPSVVETDAFSYSEKSIVYAADGETVLAEFRLENREPLNSLDQIAPALVQATVATEDSRFYEHNGVDLYGIFRALLNNVLGGSLEGASTITQQLVRNTILADEMTDISLQRKVREAELAMNLEDVYSKDEILLMYLNTINYGDGAYGIEAASQHYFGISSSDLSIAQAATLAAIPNSPSNFNPVYNPEACLERRNLVLNRMYTAGNITEEEYQNALATELNLNVQEDDSFHGIYEYPYFTSYVRSWLQEEYTTSELFEGGLKIYTTLDIDTQKAAEAACEAQYDRMDDVYEAAMVAIDPSNGHVVAMVGGKDFEENQFNIATQKGRPTGSTFKAFTLVAALEEGINPATKIDCSSRYTLKSGQGTVENFGGIDYGTRSIASATAVSSNTAYVQMQEELGGNTVIEVARRMGVVDAQLSAYDTLTLGVFDVTPLEMASAYATLASGGIYYEPVVVSKIEDKNGNVIYESEQEGERVLSESIAGAATDVLKTVFTQSDGTGRSAQLAGGRPVAGKTGTSSDFMDHWMVGYTPNLVCSVWIGDRNNVHADEDVNCNYLFKTFMDAALSSTPNTPFPSYTTPPYNSELNYAFKTKKEAADVSGKTKDEALAELEDYEVTVEEEYSDSVPAGTVISMSQDEDKVTIVVSKGPKEEPKNDSAATTPESSSSPEEAKPEDSSE